MKSNLPTNGMAISSVVLGAIALPTAIVPFLNFLVFVIGPLGMLFGWIAIQQIKKNPETMKGSGLALTGLLLNVSGTALTVLLLVIVFAAVS
jgi:hypothetical protein